MYLDIEAQAALGAMRRAELRRELIGAQLARQARQARHAQTRVGNAGGSWEPLSWLRAAVAGLRVLVRANRPAV